MEWLDFYKYYDAIEYYKMSRWVAQRKSKEYHCLKHNVYFNLNNEPCWECWKDIDNWIPGEF